jgi:hypothetical protein
MWLSYLLSQLPVDPGWEILRGAKGGLFVAPLVLGTCIAGAALWASLRVRRLGCFLAVAVSFPVEAICWWQLLCGQFPLPPK